MRTIPILLASAAVLFLVPQSQSQPPPDCSFTLTWTANGALASQDNRPATHPCVAWRATYTTSGTLQSALAFQTSSDNPSFTSVPNTVCSSTVQPPCISEGANPTAAGRTGNLAVRAYDAWVRL